MGGEICIVEESVAESQCDFDGDTFDDKAISAAFEDIGAIQDAGAVNVLYGSGGGLTATGDDIWYQDVGGIQGTSEASDLFGSSLACGDFDDDGYDDLAIGAPGEAIGTLTGAGAVNVLYGSADGLTATGNDIWYQDIDGIEGTSEASDLFGTSLTSGDFDDDGHDDLAIGAPGEAIGTLTSAGAVNVLYGSADGLTATGNDIWYQDIDGIEGTSEASDLFGTSLTSGDFDDDGHDDLAIGAPGEDIGSLTSAGAVNVIYGAAGGLIATTDDIWYQNIGGVQGTSEAFDLFGASLSSGDFDKDGYDDLAIGAPEEAIGSLAGAGAVNAIYGSTSGLTPTGNDIWYQDVGGVQGVSESFDRFGG
jgi:hypothetical protein